MMNMYFSTPNTCLLSKKHIKQNNELLTNSKVLQLRSQPDEEQQRPMILFENIASSRVRPPKAPHQSTTMKYLNKN